MQNEVETHMGVTVNREEIKIMRYFVNDNCIGCGLCVSTCPEVFSMSDENVSVAMKEDVPEDCLDSAAQAKDGCPVEAIEEA